MVGGPISLAKTFWLNYALLMFYLVPFFFWRDRGLSPNLRRLFGAIFLSFAARALVEFWLAFLRRGWRCEYGIAHDAFTFILIAALLWRSPQAGNALDRAARGLAMLVQLTLVIEAYMAWSFSRLASPADGIYFAADNDHFRSVNQASWVAIMFLYPALAWLLWRTTYGRNTAAE